METIAQKARGVRDFNASQAIIRNKIIATLREVFELFGYNPIETPVLERYELFASKYGIGENSDAMAETFKLKDQGNRDLVLRTEFTMPFARFIAENPNIKMPFKRYQLGPVFRDGPIKLGRYREFWQCDADVVGIKNNLIDAEILQMAVMVFEKLQLPVVIKINNRKILNAILEKSGITPELQKDAIISIDKLDKIGENGVIVEMVKRGVAEKSAKQVIKLINISGNNQEIIKQLQEILGENRGLQEIAQTLRMADIENIIFTPSLARGLAYYTGNVFEVFLRDTSLMSSALSGGGRYDEMISGLIGRTEQIPCIGISFGLDTIFDVLKEKNSGNEQKSVAKIYLIGMNESAMNTIFDYAKQLRQNNIKVDIEFLSRKINKALEYANSYGIEYVGIIGEEELKKNKINLKDMRTGKQSLLKLKKLIKLLK